MQLLRIVSELKEKVFKQWSRADEASSQLHPFFSAETAIPATELRDPIAGLEKQESVEGNERLLDQQITSKFKPFVSTPKLKWPVASRPVVGKARSGFLLETNLCSWIWTRS